MEHKVVYNIRVTKNFFCATFINVDTGKTAVCHMLDDKKSSMDILPKIINNCVLIGYGNKDYDDIILNFLYYHKDSDNRDLYTFSNMINAQKEFGEDLWRNSQIEFYMNKYVDSVDLSQVINIDAERYLGDDTDTIMQDEVRYSNEILSGLNRFLEANRRGFKRGVNRPTSESTKLNYILRKIL